MVQQYGTRREAMRSDVSAVAQGEELLRRNPYDGTVASRVKSLRAVDARRAANEAARAFPLWSQCSPETRREVLLRTVEALRANADEIGAMMQAEIGATPSWQAFNLDMACRHLEEAAKLTQHLVPGMVDERDGESVLLREPVGVCLGIAPWNAPLVLGVRAVATALACGNTVVLKASELCPGTHLLIGKAFAEAGLPEGALQIVTHAQENAEEIVRALVDHPAVRRINFTGSSRVGRIVAEMAARQLKRCLLELSDKSPLIVLEDADLEAAADAAAFGAFLNQGQVCMATERIIVLEPVADEFVHLLAARARAYVAGDPAICPLGPLVTEAAAQRVERMIDDAVGKGARLLSGGVRRGVMLDATVLDHVGPGMAVYSDECFGPVAAVCRAHSEEEAVTMANDTRYGLTAAVFSRDTERAMQVARRLETGMCHINGPTLHDRADRPVGGLKDSGYGRFGGLSALDEFTELRWISRSHRTADGAHIHRKQG